MRLEVTEQAKRQAKQSLELRRNLPKSKRFGLSPEEAKKKGVASGVSRARQLINSKSISFKDAKRVASFYQRFKNCRTEKCEGAIKLWGGRKFGRKAVSHVKKLSPQ